MALVLCCISHPVAAQDWARFVSPEDGFSANYPGKPKIETTTYQSEHAAALPAKVYSAADALGRYSTTVVDYRGIEKMHADRAAKCQAAGARTSRTATRATTTSASTSPARRITPSGIT